MAFRNIEANVSQVRKPRRGRREAERLDGQERRDKLLSRRGLEVMEDIKLLVEKKFIDLEKWICVKMNFRQEFLGFGENKSVIIYISLHNSNGILSKYILKNLKLKSI